VDCLIKIRFLQPKKSEGSKALALPTFLGIGVPRAGTTWLRNLLASHSDVYLPPYRQEIHFFDQYHERGLQWYKKLFPPDNQATRYQVIGEITPQYLYCPHCPERIANIPSITKLILIARNPLDRAYSHYGFWVRDKKYTGSFEDFLSSYPFAIQWGFYSRNLKDYLRYFRRDQILGLIYEQATADVSKTKETLAHFLGLAVKKFPETTGIRTVNRSYIPKARLAFALSANVANHLRQSGLGWIVDSAKRLGLDEQFFGEAGSLPPMEAETRRHLRKIYENEIRELELLLQIDLECWK
jgi:hypothetical protein